VGWSARGDSNPDLHGLNVPRLPIAPRAGVVTMGGLEPPRRQALDLPPLPGLGYMVMVPPGGLEPPLHGLRGRCAAFTLRRDWSRHRVSNPDLGHTRAACFRYHHGDGASARLTDVIGLEGRGPAVGRHSHYWFGLPVSNTDRLSSIHRHPSVVKDPTRFELVGSKGFEPNRPAVINFTF
jgi:hypothetical protein